MVNVAINGFGRIGRNTLRAAIAEGIFDKYPGKRNAYAELHCCRL